MGFWELYYKGHYKMLPRTTLHTALYNNAPFGFYKGNYRGVHKLSFQPNVTHTHE